MCYGLLITSLCGYTTLWVSHIYIIVKEVGINKKKMIYKNKKIPNEKNKWVK